MCLLLFVLFVLVFFVFFFFFFFVVVVVVFFVCLFVCFFFVCLFVFYTIRFKKKERKSLFSHECTKSPVYQLFSFSKNGLSLNCFSPL